MLMHEWIRYRQQKVKQTDGEEEAPDGDEEAAAEPKPQEAVEEAAAEAFAEATTGGEAEVAEAPESAAAEDEAEAGEPDPVAEVESAEAAQPEADDDESSEADEAQAAPGNAESTLTDREAVLSSLQEELDRAGASMKERLSQLQARQRQLPMEVEETEAEADESGSSRKATETRQELVQRLLDPVLTLREAALLIDVCPTTVRRYTNRGLLNCFRTPGNQRRFHLSDILEFLERRERGEV